MVPAGAPPAAPAGDPAWRRLTGELAGLGRIMVAFSGGVDSSLLLAAATRALGPRAVTACLCRGDFTTAAEVERARALASGLGVELLEADAGELADEDIRANNPQRCYFCKRRRFLLMRQLAAERGIAHLVEGSQADDAADFRPGARAVAELGVLSPLAAAGLGKAEVRRLSRLLGLATAELPAAACLASRIPWSTPLSAGALARVARSEEALAGLLPPGYRVRDHHPIARLELPADSLAMAAAEPLREKIVAALTEAGYRYVCLDLEGYRSGGGQL